MKLTNIPRVLAAIAATWAIGQANAGIFDSIDKFVGSKGSAMEIVYGHAGQQGLPASSYGITLEKPSSPSAASTKETSTLTQVMCSEQAPSRSARTQPVN